MTIMKQLQLCVWTIAMAVAAGAVPAAAQERLRIVASLTTYADIARQIVGDRHEVTAIGDPAENPHFVQPKPSLALVMRRADMLITTGLDLELWLPALLDKASNPRIASGAPGFVAVHRGIRMLEVPQTVSRSEGDTHIFGNPHIWTEPANAVIIGGNILIGLCRVDPANADYYEARYAAWKERLMRAYVGDEIVDLLGVDALVNLDRESGLWDFIADQSYQGQPLSDRLGGWLEVIAPFRGREMVCYHKEWSYFGRAFQIPCVEFIEPKPGIPPTPRHVAKVIALMRERQIPVLFSTNYFDRGQVEMVARRTGATAVIVPSNVDGAPNTETYIKLVSLWVTRLADAFREHDTAAPSERGSVNVRHVRAHGRAVRGLHGLGRDVRLPGNSHHRARGDLRRSLPGADGRAGKYQRLALWRRP
jgi:zinc/manganese transport system substrate-binding protein